MGFWGKLGHILAPIGKAAGYAAAPFTGGLSLLAEPAIGAAEGALEDKNGDGKRDGWSGALKGGAIGAAEAAIPYGIGKIPGLSNIGGGVIGKMLGGAVKQEAGGLANNAIHNLLGPRQPGGGSMPSSFGTGPGDLFGGGGYATGGGGSLGYDENGNETSDPSQVYQDMDGNIVQGNTTGPTLDQARGPDFVGPEQADAQGGTGFIQKLLASLKGGQGGGSFADRASDIAKIFGGIEDAEANNRYKKADMTQAYDRLALEAAQNRRLDETDAMKKLHQSGYILGGGSKYGQQPIGLHSGTLPIFPNGPMAPTDAMKQGASTLQDQMLKRLQPGGSWAPTKPDYLDRGKLETAGQWGGLGGAAGGVLGDIFGAGKTQPNPYADMGSAIAKMMAGSGNNG